MLQLLAANTANSLITAIPAMSRACPPQRSAVVSHPQSLFTPSTPCSYGLGLLMAAAQGAGDREALKDLSVIYRDGIGVAADANESMRWAAVLSLADNIASGAQVLQQLGYPRGFTGVVMSSSSAAAASMDTTPVVNGALVTSLQQPPGFPASLFSCCFQTSVRRARSHPPSSPHSAITRAQVSLTADSILLLWSTTPQPAFLGVCRAAGMYYIPNSSYKHALLPAGEFSHVTECVFGSPGSGRCEVATLTLSMMITGAEDVARILFRGANSNPHALQFLLAVYQPPPLI